MFIIDDDNLVKLGEFLKDIRIAKKMNFKEVSKVTKIDVATLNRLEKGLIKKVNPLMLLNLAKFYDFNVVYFYVLLGYLTNDEVVKYSNSIGHTSNDEIAIPLYDSINTIEDKKSAIGKMNIPFSKSNSNLYSAFYSKKDIFIFYKTEKLNNEDFFIFLANSKYIISKYFLLNSTIILSDIQDNYKLYAFDKKSVKIIGKIIYQTKKLAKE